MSESYSGYCPHCQGGGEKNLFWHKTILHEEGTFKSMKAVVITCGNCNRIITVIPSQPERFFED